MRQSGALSWPNDPPSHLHGADATGSWPSTVGDDIVRSRLLLLHIAQRAIGPMLGQEIHVLVATGAPAWRPTRRRCRRCRQCIAAAVSLLTAPSSVGGRKRSEICWPPTMLTMLVLVRRSPIVRGSRWRLPEAAGAASLSSWPGQRATVAASWLSPM